MMKEIWTLLLIFLLPWMTTGQSAPGFAEDPILQCEMENSTFQEGEELIYKIFYNLDFIWIPAGEVIFRIKSDSNRYYIHAEGNTFPSYEWFYTVDDVYETVLDKETLLPVTAERSLKEGGYRLYEYVEFDQDLKKAHVTRGRSKSKATDRGWVDLTNCTSDLLGLLFRLRNIDRDVFAEQEVLPIDFFLDMQEYNINMKYLKEERKRIRGLGRFDAIKVSPNLIAGKVFREGDEMVAWVSNDQNKVPLMIESPLTVGSAKAVLKSYRGLKYPLGG